MSLADHYHFLPVTRALLRTEGTEPAPALLNRLHVASATGYRILRFYAHHGAIHTSRKGIQTDARKLVSLAGGLRADCSVPDREINQAPSLTEAVHALKTHGIPFAAAFRTAANRIGYFEPSETTSLFIARSGLKQAVRLLDRPGGKGRVQLHAHDLSRLELVEDAEAIPITSVLQTVLDLAADPLGGAHRAFLDDVLKRRGEIHA